MLHDCKHTVTSGSECHTPHEKQRRVTRLTTHCHIRQWMSHTPRESMTCYTTDNTLAAKHLAAYPAKHDPRDGLGRIGGGHKNGRSQSVVEHACDLHAHQERPDAKPARVGDGLRSNYIEKNVFSKYTESKILHTLSSQHFSLQK